MPGASITSEHLATANSLKGMVLPYGTKHEYRPLYKKLPEPIVGTSIRLIFTIRIHSCRIAKLENRIKIITRRGIFTEDVLMEQNAVRLGGF